MPHSLTDQWTAHVTLARRVGGPQLGQAVGDLAGDVIELVGMRTGTPRFAAAEAVDGVHLVAPEAEVEDVEVRIHPAGEALSSGARAPGWRMVLPVSLRLCTGSPVDF
jgi:sugar phosphate isomerase/epimerase